MMDQDQDDSKRETVMPNIWASPSRVGDVILSSESNGDVSVTATRCRLVGGVDSHAVLHRTESQPKKNKNKMFQQFVICNTCNLVLKTVARPMEIGSAVTRGERRTTKKKC